MGEAQIIGLVIQGGFAVLVLLLIKQGFKREDTNAAQEAQRARESAEREKAMGARLTDLENRSFELTKQVVEVVQHNTVVMGEMVSVVKTLEARPCPRGRTEK